MQPSSIADIVRRLRELGSFKDDQTAANALYATLEALGGLLASDERDALCRALPPELTPFVQKPSLAEHRRAYEFFLDVASVAGVRLGLAIAHAEVVCRVLGEVLTPTARARLALALPDIGKLMQPPSEPARFPGWATNMAALGDWRRSATSDGPHAETKRSAACGLLQEREARMASRFRASKLNK